MTTIKIFRHGYEGYTPSIIKYLAYNGHRAEIVKLKEQADYFIVDDEYQYKYSRKTDNSMTIKDLMVKYSNNTTVTKQELFNIVDQCLSVDPNSQRLGSSLLFNLSFAIYGDIVHIMRLNNKLFSSHSEKSAVISRLINSSSFCDDDGDEIACDSMESSIINYMVGRKLINNDMYIEFANYVFNKFKNPNNIRICLNNGADQV